MRLYYQQIGNHDKYLVILHGLFGMSDNWHSIARKLAEQYTVILPDLRNHGKSPHHPLMTYQSLVDDVLELLQVLGKEKYVIIGHSLGGKTLMKIILDKPKNPIGQAVVVDVAPRKYKIRHGELLSSMLSLDLKKIISRKEADAQMADIIPDRQLRQFLLKNLFWKAEKQLDWRCNLENIQANMYSIGEKQSRSTPSEIPVLFLRGGNSDYVTNEDSKEIQSLFINSRIETIHNAGHWLHTDQPKLFCESVLSFLN